MKTLKFALIAAFISLALVGYSTDNKTNTSLTLKISVKKALEERGLVRQMYIQLDESFLNSESTRYYFARVTFRDRLYVIYGTHEDWVSFFLMDNHLPLGVKSATGNENRIIN